MTTAIARWTRIASRACVLIMVGALASQPLLAAGKTAKAAKSSKTTTKSEPQESHAPPTSGPSPKPIGTFKDWTAYTMQDQGKTVCFIVSEPKSKTLSDPKAQRGDPFFLVTRWSAGQALQPSLIMGFPQAPDSKTQLKIGTDEFDMFVDGDGAWMESEDGDKKLTDAMRKGATITVTAQSAHGTKSTDRYSLAGISDALAKIADCK